MIGIDASAGAMAEASRRADRGKSRRPNALFLVEAAEALPGPLAAAASEVSITFPWGSLLRGVLGVDRSALAGVASIVAPDGRVVVLASVVPADRVDGIADPRCLHGAGDRRRLALGRVRARLDPPRDARGPGRHAVVLGATSRRPPGLPARVPAMRPVAEGRQQASMSSASRSPPRCATLATCRFDPSVPTACRPPAEDLRTWPR